MEDIKPGILTYDDNPDPHLDNGPTWPEFIEAWRDMEEKGWPEVSAAPPKAEIVVTKEQRERLAAHIARMTEEAHDAPKTTVMSAGIAKAIRKLLRKG